jgi:hypothetical protein
MPRPQQQNLVLRYQLFDPAALWPAKPTALLKSDRVEPELRSIAIALDMHVRRISGLPNPPLS